MLQRSQPLVGLVVILLIAVGTAFAVGATAGLFVDGEPMQAEFTDAAGLESGAFVYVGGHRAGIVTGVDIDGGSVMVDFTLTVEEIPEDSMAEITLTSALGRRGLTIVPGSSSSFLEEGSVIPVDRTVTPVDLPELGDEGAELLGEVDVDALQDLTTALGDITDGNREDVQALLEGVEDVTTIVVDRRDEIEAVLDRATTIVEAVNSKDQELVALIDDFGSVLSRLVDRRADVTRLLQETAATSTLTAELLEERRAQIDRTLASFTEDLELIDRHQVDLAHTLAYLPAGLEGFAGIGYSGGEAQIDNPTWGNVFATNLGSIGVGSLLECNGALDQLFTDLLGPDPRCEQQGDGPPAQGPQPSPPATGDDASPLPPVTIPDLDPLLDDLRRPLENGDVLDRLLGLPESLLGGAL